MKSWAMRGKRREFSDPRRAALVARLRTAEAYRDNVLLARRTLAEALAASMTATSSHATALRALEAANLRLRELESGRGAQLASDAGVTVYEFWLEIPGYEGPIRGARAELTQRGDVHQVSDVTGTTRSGLGGAVVGGLLLGPVGAVAGLVARRKNTIKTEIRTVDTRECELCIDGPGYAWSTIAGPSAATALREIRDSINARGSSVEDVRDVASKHRDAMVVGASAVEQTEAACVAANEVTAQKRAAYDAEWDQYSGIRPPILLDGLARWDRAGWLGKSAAIVAMIVFGPLMLGAWAGGIAVAHADMAWAAGATGAAHMAALVAAAVYYVKRVRLRK
jgi:hypothetical protein